MEINKKELYKTIKENIYSCVTEPIKIDDVAFHHNLHSSDVVNAIKYGLLSKINQVRIIEKRELTEKEKFIFSDENHVNGANFISLSNMKDDFKLMYRDEFKYDAYDIDIPDIIVSKKVKSCRSSILYFNEFLVSDNIPNNMFNSINVRILKYINRLCDNLSDNQVNKTLEYYNNIRKIALIMKELELNIPLREVSYVSCVEEENTNSYTLDLNRVIDLPKIKVK